MRPVILYQLAHAPKNIRNKTSRFKRKIGFFLAALFCMVSATASASGATCTWNGSVDSNWATAGNWTGCTGGGVPAATDSVVLDNSVVAGSYTVNLPGGAVNTTLVKLTITPTGTVINLILPATNTNNPGFTVGDGSSSTDDLVLDSGAVFTNSSGASAGNGLAFNTAGNGILRINNGGRYLHNTLRGNSGIVSQLSQESGTENGTVEFDVPGTGSFSPSASGRVFGNLTLTRTAGPATYSIGGGTEVTILGNLTINSGVTLTSNMTGAMNLAGNLTNNGAALSIPAAQTVNLEGTDTQTISGSSAITFGELTVDCVGVSLSRDLTVSSILLLTEGRVTTNANTLIVGSSSVGRNNGYVVGNLRLTFSGPASRVFHVGTDRYTPVNFSATGGTFPADFTVRATDVPHPNVNAATSIRRYWILTNTTVTSADIDFQYFIGDNNSDETNYKVIRISNGTAVGFPSSTVNSIDSIASVQGVTSFSDWTVGDITSPTAAEGVISGTITDRQGQPVAGAVVHLSGSQNRKTITDARGHYQFDNVETAGFYTVTPSRANYGFNPGARSFTQLGESTEATFTAVATGQNANPLDTPEYFVRQHYLDFLGREPDEAGFNFWSDQILACGDDVGCAERRTINVSAAYFLSIEFQQTGGLVDRLYRASYGRNPLYAEFMPDSAAIARGVVVGRKGWEQLLAANKESFVNSWVERAAFHSAFDSLSNADYVAALVSNTGVSYAQSERDSLVSDLDAGRISRADALQQIAGNEDFAKARFNEAFVMMEYFGYLRRDPDEAGYRFWLNKLSEFNGDFERAEMVKAFINSGEYRARFPR